VVSFDNAVLSVVTMGPATAVVVLALTRVVVIMICLRGTEPEARPEILRAAAELFRRGSAPRRAPAAAGPRGPGRDEPPPGRAWQ
jgi:hypothetical protein